MKKLITIALLCAMLLSCFAGCAMQKGEVDVENYVEEAEAQNTAFRTELQNADEYSGTPDTSWFEGAKAAKKFTITTAEQLVGFRDLIGAGNDFSGWTITLGVDADLKGTALDAFGEKAFKGTFDGANENGDNHVIANWSTTSTVACAGFFPSLASGATVKNVSFVNGTVSGTSSVGTIGKVYAGDKATVTITNVYSNVKVTGTDKAGGIIGESVSKTTSIITVENCEFIGTLNSSNGSSGGIIGYNSGILAVKGCNFAGTMTTAGAGSGGIVGSNTGTLTVDKCKSAGTLNATGAETGGIVGVEKSANPLSITNCEFTGKLNSNNIQVGGIVGKLTTTVTGSLPVIGVPEVTTISEGKASAIIEGCKVTSEQIKGKDRVGGVIGNVNEESAYCLLVKDCSVTSKTVATSTMSGGLVGYVDKAIPIVIVGCDVAGSYEGGRTSGGLIGTLNAKTKQCAIRDCKMTATLTIKLTDTKNNAGGGLIGKLQSPLNLTNCHVDATMNFTYTPKAKVDSDYGNGAGGLIGRVFTNAQVNINDCSVDGEIKFTYQTYLEQPLYAGRLIGSIGTGDGQYNPEKCKVRFGENVVVNPELKVTLNGGKEDNVKYFNYETAGCVPAILPVGFQTKTNANTYDLRYVFAMNGDQFEAAGVRALIRSIQNNELVENAKTIYVEKVYTSVKDNEGTVYEASKFGYDYLYTVVIEGIPAEYNFDAENLQIVLAPFGANEVENKVVVESGSAVSQGVNLVPTVQYQPTDFSVALSENFVADITLAGADATGFGIHPLTQKYEGDTVQIIHYYLETSNTEIAKLKLADGTQATKGDFYMTWTFNVETEGYYDMTYNLRLKNKSLRENIIVLDGKELVSTKYTLNALSDADFATLKDAHENTYLNAGTLYLTAGQHTLTMKISDTTGSSFHFRNIYLVKADVQ